MSNRLTFSLASLTLLIALGLVFVTTPAMAATLSGSVSDQTWVQGQSNISITLPKATAETDDGVLTVSLYVDNTEVATDTQTFASDNTAAGPIRLLTFTSTIVAASGNGADLKRATATGTLKGDNAHNAIADRILVTYTVNEASASTNPDPAPVSATFTVEITDAPALMFPAGASIADIELIVGDAYSAVLPAAVGGVGPLAYQLLGVDNESPTGVFSGGNLPAGLTFTAASRLLSGIPTTVDPRAVITYRVTDSDPVSNPDPMDNLSFTIAIKARPTGPSFAFDKVDDAKYTKKHAITALTLDPADTTYATGSVTYKLEGTGATDTDPKLPKGLSFDTVTRELTGTPEANDTFNLTYTATDEAGLNDTATFKIIVADEVKVKVPTAGLTGIRGKSPGYEISIDAPTGGTGTTQTVVTGLPDELTFADMKITGDPVAVGPITVTITATDENGASDTADFTITVNAAPNLSFNGVVVPQTYEVGKAIIPMLLPKGVDGVGPSYTYAIDTATPLPDGISFDPKTRLLSGTPTTAKVTAAYNYVISDSAFSHVETPTADQVPNTVTLPITLTVMAQAPNSAPTFGNATIPNIDATVNTPISGMFLPEATDADGDTLTYSLSPSPTAIGLTFNPANRSLTGTPTVVSSQTPYIYKVADTNGGEDTIGFFITVTGPVGPPPTDPAELRFVNASGVAVTSLPPLTLTAGAAIGTTAMPYIQLPSAIGGVGDITYSLRKGLGEVDVTSGDNGLMVDLTELRLHGTPTAAATSMQYQWRATDARGEGDAKGVKKLNFMITVSAAPTPANNAPDVTITTTPPTTAQTGSFPIAYTATDPDGDTLTMSYSSPPTGYTFDTSVAGMVTINQAAGSNAANITVTVTATDPSRASDSDSISVIFAERGMAPVDSTPPTVAITIAPAADMTVAGKMYTDVLSITLDFNEPIDADTLAGTIGRVGGDSYSVVQISDLMVSSTDNTVYVGHVNSPGYRTRAETRVLLKRGVADLAGNVIATDQIGIYKAPVATVAISGPAALNCEIGGQITLTVTGTSETLVAGDITIGAGWKMGTDNNPSDGTFDLVPDGHNALGVTSVAVDVKANAVSNNAAVSKTFTVGPVLTIPAGGYIVVLRPEHRSSTHLNDPLYLGSLGVRGQPISIQEWECMPDLTIFLGRSGAGSGGGALVVKQSHAHTGAAIGKGSVGISEIMWASDEGTIHGQTSNTMQAREQWIELHNLNGHEVKVTLFARPTTQALVTEANEIDRASNFELNNSWVVKGQNGNSALGTNFVSMFRSKNNNNYAHGDNNGKNKDKWQASTLIYRTRASGLAGRGATNPTYSFLGTPGRSNTISPAGPPVKTNVPNSPVIFNEVANLRDQTLEWIELKNVSTGEVNLRNYHISFVTGVNSEKGLYTFPNNDNTKIPAGGILLLVDTDPRYDDDHPIAVGYNIHGGNDQALGIGANAPRYMVTDFAEGGLPDNGEFVLMLRRPDGHDKAGTASNKHGTEKNMIDAVGYHPDLKSAGAPLYTDLWPLKLFGAPNKSRNKMEVETVHYRRHAGHDPDQGDNNKPEQIALNNASYTGVGYKRHAQGTPAHGGSPGYENGTSKSLASEISQTGLVTISEIMFDQGDGRYPQWIELYNSSPTQPVNLKGGKTGWKLVIENYDDGEIPVDRLSGTLNFRNSDVQTILPQQTVIVASTRARNSGSAFFDTAVVFPPTRVFSAWDDARDQLGQRRATDPILSTEGFYIELLDGGNDANPNGYVSDSVGNIVTSPNRRVAHEKAWELSDVTGEMMEDMGRSSILRRYREPKRGDARTWTPYTAAQLMDMGIKVEGWVAAHMTDFREVRETWFGHPDDVGSPGITGGRVLPVELSKFRPERQDDGTIVIRWLTESETNNAGFNILRSENRTGEFTKLNTQLIEGQGTTSERTAYDFVDRTAKPNVVYYYQIQDVSLDGDVQILKVTHLRGHVSADGKATTTWGELKALQ